MPNILCLAGIQSCSVLSFRQIIRYFALIVSDGGGRKEMEGVKLIWFFGVVARWDIA